MPDSRREFLKKTALLSGAPGAAQFLPESIQRALAIAPGKGSTWLDARHIVILMQENRSFDHALGTLRGVRGYNDPRAIDLPTGYKVWLQTNAEGQTYAPFRLDIRNTRATWMDSLPHSWANQVGARNDGKYDKWLDWKRNSIPGYAKMPLTGPTPTGCTSLRVPSARSSGRDRGRWSGMTIRTMGRWIAV
ncbi:MAG TPA: alkaline phosphatase family protein, partial [Puia sp.]|nr:alkaline phosphatase family protein [Puia sp.]